MVEVPPILSVPFTPFVKVLVPVSAVLTVIFPVLVAVRFTIKRGIEPVPLILCPLLVSILIRIVLLVKTAFNIRPPVVVNVELTVAVILPVAVMFIPPIPTLVVRFCVHLAVPFILKLKQAPALPFIVIVCPACIVILSAAVGTPTGNQLAAVAQLPEATFETRLTAVVVVQMSAKNENSRKNECLTKF